MTVVRPAYVIAVESGLAAACKSVLKAALPPTLFEMLDPTDAASAAPGRVCLARIVPLRSGPALAEAVEGDKSRGVPLIEFDPKRPKLVLEQLTALLVQRLNRCETASAASRDAAALLRRENISGTTRFREIESFLHSLGNPHVSRSLSWEPQGAMAEMPADMVVVQHLPVNVVSVTAIDLWLPERLQSQNCALDVALMDSAGERHVMTEVTDTLKIGSGWVRFALPMAVAGDARNCSLVLRNLGPARLAVGLGMRMPDPRFSAQGDGMPGDQVLALRVWKALAGAAIPDHRGGPLIDPHQELTASVLQASDLPAPELFASPALAQDYVTADFWAAEDVIMVHPSRSGTVCAVIRDVPMRGLRQLTALVTTGHARSPNLNFAIGVTPHGALGRDGFWESCMGPWVHGLPAHGWAQVHCVPSTPIDRADIYLATSLAQDIPNDHSWGLFRSFRAVTGARVGLEVV